MIVLGAYWRRSILGKIEEVLKELKEALQNRGVNVVNKGKCTEKSS
jgi:hypothetical protein